MEDLNYYFISLEKTLLSLYYKLLVNIEKIKIIYINDDKTHRLLIDLN